MLPTFTFWDQKQLKRLAKSEPVLNLAEFYKGNLRATGITCHPLGWVKRRFTADVTGRHKGDTLILNEDFTYDDGRKFSREWTLEALNAERTQFKGRGGDIHGDIYGMSSGCGALLRYTLTIPQKGSDKFKTISVKHWQYRVGDTKTIHKLTLSKWGMPIVKSTVVFERV